MIPRLTIKMIDNMTSTELGLLLSRITSYDIYNHNIPGDVLHRIFTKVASMLLAGDETFSSEVVTQTPRYTQAELDLVAEWSEVPPEEIFGDLDELEAYKAEYLGKKCPPGCQVHNFHMW